MRLAVSFETALTSSTEGAPEVARTKSDLPEVFVCSDSAVVWMSCVEAAMEDAVGRVMTAPATDLSTSGTGAAPRGREVDEAGRRNGSVELLDELRVGSYDGLGACIEQISSCLVREGWLCQDKVGDVGREGRDEVLRDENGAIRATASRRVLSLMPAASKSGSKGVVSCCIAMRVKRCSATK